MLPGHDSMTDNGRGEVDAHHPTTGAAHVMAHGGFAADRETLKQRCPAKFAGMTCRAPDTCSVAQGIRIPLTSDRRVFARVDRASYTWEDESAHRAESERVNSRLDGYFECELHTNRGMAKLRACCGWALLVMLGMARGRIGQQHPDLMQSLVRSA
ncbi:MAG: hypothetical protein M0Z53_03225 [Thermaerobacter sp.]|nr:hypothetical protein [Thermaerobacter sp.]